MFSFLLSYSTLGGLPTLKKAFSSFLYHLNLINYVLMPLKVGRTKFADDMKMRLFSGLWVATFHGHSDILKLHFNNP
jgi:hypothetical protein